jgi:hypothetical protein
MIKLKKIIVKRSIKQRNRASKHRGIKSDKKKSNWIKWLGMKLKKIQTLKSIKNKINSN